MPGKKVLVAFCLLWLAGHEVHVGMAATDEKATNFAFVLLSEARLPEASDIIRNFASFAPKEHRLRLRGAEGKKEGGVAILELELNLG